MIYNLVICCFLSILLWLWWSSEPYRALFYKKRDKNEREREREKKKMIGSIIIINHYLPPHHTEYVWKREKDEENQLARSVRCVSVRIIEQQLQQKTITVIIIDIVFNFGKKTINNINSFILFCLFILWLVSWYCYFWSLRLG